MIKETDRGILEIAVEYQYNSQEVFTRAFESLFGITPAKYRKEGQPINLQAKIDFLSYQKRIQGELNMNKPAILHLDPLKICGFQYETNLENERYFREIPGFHSDFGVNEYYLRLPNRAAPAISYGIACNYRDDAGFSFVIGEEVTEFGK